MKRLGNRPIAIAVKKLGTLVPVTLRLRRLSVEIDNISIERLVKRLAKVRIGFGVSYLDCLVIN